MKARISLLLAGICIAGSVGMASAKPLSRIIAEMGLSPADFEVVSATSQELLASGTPSAGQERSWSNSETGSKGTIRINDVEGNCVRLQHFIQPAGAEQSREIRTRQCKDSNGNWLMAP
ncbi:MAG: hypothetical protein AAGB28_00025 [Pseudomonadota bacterium]